MEKNIDFIRFANFFKFMLEKYGAQVMEEILSEEDNMDEEEEIT